MRDGDDVAVGEEQVLALLEQRNGQVVKLAIYREPGLPRGIVKRCGSVI